MTSNRVPVLIVGAGPTGLVLALWLAKVGVKVRLIDKTAAPGTTSRALIVHSRTLEFYRQLGLAEKLIERGFRFVAVNLWVEGEKKARVPLGELGQGLSPYPFMTIFPQDRHEELLIEELKPLGVEVERDTALVSFEESRHGVSARLRKADGSEEICEAEYLAGCDGAHSVVREQLGVGFEGGTYPDVYYVADIIGRGPVIDGELHAALDEADFLAIFPMKGEHHARLVGVIRHGDFKEDLKWPDVSRKPLDFLKIKVQEVKWFSTYHVHHRVAAHFQKGRAFLLGDAGHIHSPVGGQGMNTGIGDAVNLAWKLAEVFRHGADPILLKSYEIERIAFARTLVKTTDEAFRFVSAESGFARTVRTRLIPAVLPAIFKLTAVKKFMFRVISQTAINYRQSFLSEGRTGSVHAGDHLPWVDDNDRPLSSLAWQIHVYGPVSDAKLHGLRSLGVDVHVFSWSDECGNKGLGQGAAYLIRPDGHIGKVSVAAEAAEIKDYFQRQKLRRGPVREDRHENLHHRL